MARNIVSQNHYTYRIDFLEVPNVYFGVRSCDCLPEEDVNYMGSPCTFKIYWELCTPVKTILAIYSTRQEAELAEDELILQQWATDKPLSLNGGLGKGDKFNTLGYNHSKKSKKKMSDSSLGLGAKYFYLISPLGEVFSGTNLKQFCKSQKIPYANTIRVKTGNNFHCNGWTSSLQAHNLYVETYNTRGVSWSSATKKWRVRWYVEGEVKCKLFLHKNDAFNFRNNLASEGYKWTICCLNWRQKVEKSILMEQIKFQSSSEAA